MPSYQVKQSSTAYPLVFLLVQSSDHITGLTGATPTVTISKAGAAFGAPAGAVSEIGSGWYKVAGNATDSGTLGPLVLHATAASADPSDTLYEVVAHDVQDAVHLGLSSLPNAVAAAPNGLLTNGTGAGQLSPDGAGRTNVGKWLDTTVPAPNVAGRPLVDLTHVNGVVATGVGSVPSNVIRSGTAQAGGASTITLDSGASATNNTYQNEIVQITSGTGAGQSASIASYVGSTKVATINGTWATNPDATSIFSILPAGAITASGGNVTVGGYAAGQDPATLLLVTPMNKLATDVNNAVKVQSGTGANQISLMAGKVSPADGSIATATFAAGATIPAVGTPDLALSGTVTGSPTAGSFQVTGLPNVGSVLYTGKKLVFTSGNLKSLDLSIATDAGGAAPRTLTFSPAFPIAPANGDSFIIIG